MTQASAANGAMGRELMSQRYDYLFDRIMESAKPAIAIIYAIAFYMGWDKPYWAAVSAASVNLLMLQMMHVSIKCRSIFCRQRVSSLFQG